jgi:hypothetical protein
MELQNMATTTLKGKETEAISIGQQKSVMNNSTASEGIPVAAKSVKTKSNLGEHEDPTKNQIGKPDSQHSAAGQDPLYKTAKTNADVRTTIITPSPCADNHDPIAGNGVAGREGQI